MVRLHVIQATEKPTAIILRRGPSKWYHLIQWDMASDRFTSGAWIKGRIYEGDCDISPDGQLFLYFLHQGSRHDTALTHAWTAVSRAPWLHALAIWPQGTTYGGGGRFLDNRTVVLRSVHGDLLPDFPARGLRVIREVSVPWLTTSDEIPDADWCGRDHRNRVIYTRQGGLFRRGGRSDHLLADFTNLTPNPTPPPMWATHPLGDTTGHRSPRPRRDTPASKRSRRSR